MAVISLLLKILTTTALAFSVRDHRFITSRAIDEFNFCAQNKEQKISDSERDEIVSGNLREDFNIVRKGLHWHFYHPQKDLGKTKLGSQRSLIVRYNDLVGQNQSHPKDSRVKGALTHYLQDVACTPHVVPIFHMISDSFDNFKVSPSDVPAIADLSQCVKFEKRSWMNLLNGYAKKTLGLLDEKIEIKVNGAPTKVTWRVFWAGEEKTGFGEYGPLGNNFGKASFSIGGDSYEVPMELYRHFKARQLRQAVEATLEGLLEN